MHLPLIIDANYIYAIIHTRVSLQSFDEVRLAKAEAISARETSERPAIRALNILITLTQLKIISIDIYNVFYAHRSVSMYMYVVCMHASTYITSPETIISWQS